MFTNKKEAGPVGPELTDIVGPMTTGSVGAGAVKRRRSNIVMSIVAVCMLLGVGPFALSRLDAQPAAPPAAGYHFPVAGAHHFTNDWGAPRGGGTRKHMGNDVFAQFGTPVVAVTSGIVYQRREALGGRSVYLMGDDGNQYYCTHLSGFGKAGRVIGGDAIGTVGNDGDARTTPPHCHFEMRLGAHGRMGGGVKVNPFATLKAWEANDQVPANRVLLNPGFEEGDAHWVPGNGNDMDHVAYREPQHAKSGVGFLEFSTPAPDRSMAQTLKSSGTAPRSFSIWLRCRSDIRCDGSIVLWALGKDKPAERRFSIGTTWTWVSTPPLAVPPGTADLRAEVYLQTVNTRMDLDDASVAPPAQLPR